MKKHYLFIALCATLALGLVACGDKKDEETTNQEQNNYGAGDKEEDHLLSADESKEKLMGVAQMLSAKFNPKDQKAAIDLADNLIEKYEEYSWNDLGDYFENKYEPIFSMPRYAADVAAGRRSAASFMTSDYVFSFSKDKAIFESNDAARTWKYVGQPTEDCVILRCKDSKGVQCEAKCWPEGSTKLISYSYETQDREGRPITKTIQGELPDKIIFTLKQGSTEHIRFELSQDINTTQLNRVKFDLMVRVSNLSWTTNVNMNPTNGSLAFGFKYGDESLIKAAVNLPSYKLIAKTEQQSYEDWLDQYEERYEDLIANIDGADASLDILGWVQVKAKISDFKYVYQQAKKLDEYGFFTSNRADAEELCKLISEHQSNGIYYGSDIKQAEVRIQLGRDTRYDYNDREYYEYYPEAVLYFPQDKTTYAFDQYFDSKPFTDLQNTIENLANAYIKSSKYLNDEVGEVEF